MTPITIKWIYQGQPHELPLHLDVPDEMAHSQWDGQVIFGDDGESRSCTWHRVQVNAMTLLEVPADTMCLYLQERKLLVKMPQVFRCETINPR